MTLGVPYSFVPGPTIISAQVNDNFQAIVTYINGLSIPTTPVSIANGGTGSATAPAALTALGLASGTIIPGTVVYSASGGNGTLTFTGASSAPTVAAYGLGNFYAFQVPATETFSNLYFIDATTSGSGLTALQVYDNPGFSPTVGITSDQFMLLAFEPIADTFVLLNAPGAAITKRFAEFSSNGSLVVPAGITTMYATGAAPGGGGGSCAGAGDSGGGGGGGGAAGNCVPFTVSAGHTLTVSIGSGGAGGSGSAGSAGGTTTIVDSSTSTTLISWTGGAGGAEGTGTGFTTGGTGGSPTGGGVAGGVGQAGFFAGSLISYGGAGGFSLLSAGAAGGIAGTGGASATGQSAISYGAGGAGGAGPAAAGGTGGPSFIRLDW